MDEFWKSVLEKIAATAREAIEADDAGRFPEACAKYERAARETDSMLNNPNKNAVPAATRASLARSAESYVKRIKQIRNKPKPETEAESKSDLTADSLFVEKPNVKWDDVLGCDEAIENLQQSVIEYLRQPQSFDEPLHGCLLYGPPGTGKTMLAKALATEANASFMVVPSSEIVSKWQGNSEKNMRDVFRIARHRAPTIIFFDEADALLKSRSDSNESTAVNRMKTIFMTETEGFTKSEKFVFIVAATNFPWDIDAACLRRLERTIYIGLPSFENRIALLSRMTNLDPFELIDVARDTEFYTGANFNVAVKISQTKARTEWQKYGRWRLVKNEWCGFYKEDRPTCCLDSKETCAECGSVYMTSAQIPPGSMARPVPLLRHVMESIREVSITTNESEIARYLKWGQNRR